jgi:hypothetical protein
MQLHAGVLPPARPAGWAHCATAIRKRVRPRTPRAVADPPRLRGSAHRAPVILASCLAGGVKLAGVHVAPVSALISSMTASPFWSSYLRRLVSSKKAPSRSRSDFS